MRWTERQQALLQEIGVRLWLSPGQAKSAGADADIAAAAAPTRASPQDEIAASAPIRREADRPATEPAAPPVISPARPVPVPAAAARPTFPAGEPHESVAPAAVAPAVASRRDGVAAMDWPALRAAVEGCRACHLCESRTQTVFGVGHPEAEWMLVGEAPGEQEDRQGEPFVGKAGQLLDRMLVSVGLTRAEAPPERQVYIANVLKCRPPGNRNPEPQEVAQCEPFLIRQVGLVRPRLILAMGRFAVQSLLGTQDPIGRLRGRVHQYQGVPLVVTYHPAYLLRNPLDKSKAWEDLCLAREVLAGAPPRQP